MNKAIKFHTEGILDPTGEKEIENGKVLENSIKNIGKKTTHIVTVKLYQTHYLLKYNSIFIKFIFPPLKLILHNILHILFT